MKKTIFILTAASLFSLAGCATKPEIYSTSLTIFKIQQVVTLLMSPTRLSMAKIASLPWRSVLKVMNRNRCC